MIIRTWRVIQSVVQVGTRRIKTIGRKSVMSLERSERRPKRTTNRVQNSGAKKKK
jgi:hypothetical protein